MSMPDLRTRALADFRRRCKEQSLAFTFQRQVIYEAVVDSREHPTPIRVCFSHWRATLIIRAVYLLWLSGKKDSEAAVLRL